MVEAAPRPEKGAASAAVSAVVVDASRRLNKAEGTGGRVLPPVGLFRGNILGTFVLETALKNWKEPVADLAGNYLSLFRKEPDLIHFGYRR